MYGAGDEARTRDLNLGKVALYQLSYSRIALLHNALHFYFAKQRGASKNWSGRRGSNSRPQPWQGCALPTELFPRLSRPAIVGPYRRESSRGPYSSALPRSSGHAMRRYRIID